MYLGMIIVASGGRGIAEFVTDVFRDVLFLLFFFSTLLIHRNVLRDHKWLHYRADHSKYPLRTSSD